ncbi:MAG: rhodanese-like domain-containing protein [Halanaeroarchaeum sp.]
MVDEISPEELSSLLASGGDVRIVDIRTKPAYEREHIPGSENMPLHSLSEHVSALAGAETVVTVCPHGRASKQAVKLITSYEGIDEETRVASLEDGLEAWDGDLDASE